MNITLEELDGLERRMSFAIPAQRIYAEVKRRLRDCAGRAQLDGFRPGRAPLAVVERQFGPQLRQEVIGDLLTEAFHEAAREARLQPVGVPVIELRETMLAAPADAPEPTFVATFEVYPDFALVPPETLKIERQVVDIAETDVDAMLEALRRLHLEWLPTDRPAQRGDRVLFDLQGHMDHEPLREIRRIPLVLGAKVQGGAFGAGVQDEFARQIEGARAGEFVDLLIGFPADYEKDHLAGREVRFTLHLGSVEEPRLPALDDAFARKLGHADGLAALRAETRATMEAEALANCHALVKQRVLETLREAHPIPLPKSRVEAETQRLLEEARAQLRAEGRQEEEDGELVALLVGDRARHHVALGLILARIVAEHGLKAEPEALDGLVATIAAECADPAEAAARLRGNAGMMAELESALLEDRVVDWVLERAQVVDVPVSFGEFIRAWRPEPSPA